MLKKCVVAAAAAVLLAGTASAVSVNREGTGDFLIAPAYFIGNGMTTDLRVINTSATKSVVAKVVFRHPTSSAEVLDFLIYLSPSDVWTGTVSCVTAAANGNCAKSRVTSYDDSIQIPAVNAQTVTFASATNPAIIESDDANAIIGRTALPNQGYIEVIMSSEYDVAPNKPGVLKTAIAAQHEAGPVIITDKKTPNVLAGFVTANATGVGSATLPMVALENYNNVRKAVVGEVSGFDLTTQTTTLADVEEALWSNNHAVPYVVGPNKFTLVTYTFPTKLSFDDSNLQNQYRFPNSGQPGRVGDGKVCVNHSVYDNTENSVAANISPLPAPICFDEFQWAVFGTDIATAGFAEGWANLTFRTPQIAVSQTTPDDNTNVGRVGAPAIVTYMLKEPNKFTWAYAASAR